MMLCTFVKHPDNDEPILVTGGQFLVLFIPRHNLHCTCTTNRSLNITAYKQYMQTYTGLNIFIRLTTVALQCLIHREVAGCSQAFQFSII